MRNKFVCVHGHFYQPPRENPWTGELEPEDCAHPYRDWNSRIFEECYGPNLACPAPDSQGRVRDMRDHYRLLSFNFGPTLTAWLEENHPGFLVRLREADQASSRERVGRGNAVAQPFVHAILPLCDRRDKATLVRWGKEEFQARFGRPPEGMWLPETGVDEETLEVLIEEGIAFTILAPHQALRIRDLGSGDEGWKPVDADTLLPTRPYRWTSRRDPTRHIALFFYHRNLSRALANEGPISDAETLFRRVRGRFHPDDSVQLVHLACDGEYFGHHHRGQHTLLGEALRALASDGGVRLTNLAEFLALFPPPQEADIRPCTAWSCEHGLGRWLEDCGCRTPARKDWSQAWRGPLKDALEWLKGELDALFQKQGAELFKDPWAARDGYIERVLDPSPLTTDRFLARHARRHLSPPEACRALSLLELQRQRLLMFTSCGWFFDDISGPESVQVLKHAACAADLAAGLGAPGLGAGLRERLAKAKSNTVKFPDGGQVFARLAEPQRVGLKRLAEHAALLGHLYEGLPPVLPPRFQGAVRELARTRKAGPARHDRAFSLWRVELRDTRTLESWEGWAAVHQADRLDLACWTSAAASAPPADLVEAFQAGDDDSFRKALDGRLGPDRAGLDSLLTESRLSATRRLVLAPPGSAARGYLDRWAQAVGRLRRGEPRGDEVLELMQECRTYGLTADQLPDAGTARAALILQLRAALSRPTSAEISRLVRWIETFEKTVLHIPLWELRDLFWLWRGRLLSGAQPPAEGEIVAARALGEKLGFSESVWRVAREEAGKP